MHTQRIHCTTTSLVIWLVQPFGLVSILLGYLIRYLAGDLAGDLITSLVTRLITCVICLVTSLSMLACPNLAFTRYCFTSKLYCGSLLWESILRSLPPPTCNTYPVAIVLDAHCAIYAPPPTLPVYAIHHTISVMAISCKGRAQMGKPAK